MKIFLVRHGETNWNEDKKIQGPQSSQLTEKGVEQAKKTREYFQDQRIVFDDVYYSPTLRTIQTVSIISPDYLDMESAHEAVSVAERYHKDLVGLDKTKVEEIVGITFDRRLSWEMYFEGTPDSSLTGKFPNNETIKSVRDRVTSFCRKLLESNEDVTILVVGHSICNQYLLEFFKYGTVGEVKFDDFQKNNEIRVVSFSNGNQFDSWEKIVL